MNVYAVLMAGGVGTRFWPRSRTKSPKQVLNIAEDRTMIQATYDRLGDLVDPQRLFIVTNADQKDIIHSQLPDLEEANFLIEPFGRNTAPCIGLAAAHIAEHDPDGVMLVLPADHLITNISVFHQALRVGIRFAAENEGLITLGINPYEPATGYGYIQSGEVSHETESLQVHRVQSFAEKPNLATAQRFLDSGDFYWNSGMFIWQAQTILSQIESKLPDLHEGLTALRPHIGTPEYPKNLRKMYSEIQDISIDFGIMQKAENVFVIPVDMGWNDVGSWSTVHDIADKDAAGLAVNARRVVNVNSENAYVYAPDKAVALVGVSDIIVVDTGDALLVCHKSASQDVKYVVDKLKKEDGSEWL